MKNISIGIVDTGVGNISSLYSTLRVLGYKVKVSVDRDVLDSVDILLLPGVGAFPVVMKGFNLNGISKYLRSAAKKNRPIIGICLGMQLLTESSEEASFCKGLGLIPGKVVPINDSKWHIGWNELRSCGISNFLKHEMESPVYFNHAFMYQGPREYKISDVNFVHSIPAIIRHNNLVGFQFHPEKSQDVGRYILQHTVEELTNFK